MNHTEVLVATVGVALCAAMLAAVLRTQRPDLAICLSLLAGVAVVTLLLGQLAPLVVALRRMAQLCGVGENGLAVVLKGAGICLVAQLAADVCRDAGDTALAGKAELAGRLLLLLLAVPLYEQILVLIVRMVENQAVTG